MQKVINKVLSETKTFALAVGNLPWDIAEPQLRELFAEVGPIKTFRCGGSHVCFAVDQLMDAVGDQYTYLAQQTAYVGDAAVTMAGGVQAP